MPGLRERKKRATWAQLSGAALQLAGVHGPDGVTVEQISKAAEVSARTFFNYFPSKEDAILGTDPDRAARMRTRVTARPAEETPLEVLQAALTDLGGELAQDPEAWRLRLRLVREHASLLPSYLAALATLERTLTEALAERLGVDPEADPYPALAAAVAVSVSRTSFRRWHAEHGAVPLAELLDQAFSALARGLPPPPPQHSSAPAVPMR